MSEECNLQIVQETSAPAGGSIQNRANSFLVVGIIFAAALLRFVALDRYPLPVHQDELTDVYDGYSLWTTGADRFGDPWPAILRGMGPGDYHPGLYAYLSMISTGIAGFSVWAGRLPAAAAGVLTVWLVYVTARRHLGNRAGILAALFAAFSPIHVLYSRQSHTGLCLQPLFAILLLYLLSRTLDEHRSARPGPSRLIWTVVLGFTIGFSTNVYGAMRLSAFLFVLFSAVCLFIILAGHQRAVGRVVLSWAVLAFSAGLGAAPQLYALASHPESFFARASIVVFPLDYGPRWWLVTLTRNVCANLDPRYLFLSFGQPGDMTVARLGVASLPFLYVGLACALAQGLYRRWRFGLLLLLSVAIFLLPAAASKPNPNAMRSSGVWALYPLVSALGAVALGGLARSFVDRWNRRSGNRFLSPSRLQQGGPLYATSALCVVIVALGLFDVARYVQRSDLHGIGRQNDLVRLGEWLSRNGAGYDRIYVETDGLFPYFYLAVFSGMNPAEFQRTPREGTVTKYGWEHFHHFGRFWFVSADRARADWEASPKNESWLVVGKDGSRVELAAGSHVAPTASEPGDIHVVVDSQPQT